MCQRETTSIHVLFTREFPSLGKFREHCFILTPLGGMGGGGGGGETRSLLLVQKDIIKIMFDSKQFQLTFFLSQY